MALKRSVQKVTVSAATIYTCPAGTDAVVQSLVVADVPGSGGSFTVTYYNSTTATTETIIPTTTVSAGASYSYPRSINLKPTDYIQISGTADMTVQLSVYELETTVNGFTPIGAWSSGASYNTNDVVTLSGSSYVAIQPSNNQNPSTATAYWLLLAAKGDAGAAGTNGTNGAQGYVAGALYSFSTNTTVSGVTSGQIRWNNAAADLVTSIGISCLDVNSNNLFIYIQSWKSGDTIVIQSASSTGTQFSEFPLTGSPTNVGGASGYWLIPVAFGTGSTPTDGQLVSVTQYSKGTAGLGYNGLTSTTSNTIGTGSKTFTTNLAATATAFSVGERVRVASTANPANYMEGIITSFSSTTLVVNVDLVGGSGTLASWNFGIAGDRGATGSTGNTGAQGPTGPKGISVAGPTGSENITLFYTTQALTLSQVRAVVAGTSPSVTYTISSGSDRSSATTTHVNAATVTSSTTGTDATIANASISANTWLWITTSAAAAGTTRFHVTFNFS